VQLRAGSEDWDQITYTYDPGGRRIAKAYDGGSLGFSIWYLRFTNGLAFCGVSKASWLGGFV